MLVWQAEDGKKGQLRWHEQNFLDVKLGQAFSHRGYCLSALSESERDFAPNLPQ
jgi:hypothetical protein